MGQQLAACSSVCSFNNASGAVASADVPLQSCPPQVKLLAWMRRRNGADCDFGAVFEELFGSREPVGCTRFEQVLNDRGFHSNAKMAFQFVDRYSRRGTVGADDFEAWQNEIEDKEAEGLKNLRDFLKSRFPTPSAAYKELGKGEGDVLTLTEFIDSLAKVGFSADNKEELFRFIDKDYSGEVTFAEFKTVMRHAGNRKKQGSPKNSPGRGSPRRSPRDRDGQKRNCRGGVVAAEARRNSS